MVQCVHCRQYIYPVKFWYCFGNKYQIIVSFTFVLYRTLTDSTTSASFGFNSDAVLGGQNSIPKVFWAIILLTVPYKLQMSTFHATIVQEKYASKLCSREQKRFCVDHTFFWKIITYYLFTFLQITETFRYCHSVTKSSSSCNYCCILLGSFTVCFLHILEVGMATVSFFGFKDLTQ